VVADGVGAEAGQHLVRVGADPAGLGSASLLAGLRAGGFLWASGWPVLLHGAGEGLVPASRGGANLLAGLGPGPLDGSVQ
jgi:hypothetical protein